MDQSTETSAVPFGVEQMSEFIYDVLCNGQIREHAFGQDGSNNSLEIQWNQVRDEWQLIRDENGRTTVRYDHLYEGSFLDEDPELLYDIIENWDMVEKLQDQLEDAE